MAGERVERRLAAILAADVAGYSRLVGIDEEGTLAALRRLRRELVDPRLAEHRGRIVKTTGDGLLVEFASVVDALRCAAETQREMAERNAGVTAERRIELRIGIHQGDIVVEDGDIFGDGVNVAARLEALAEPGGICVSARVQEDAAGRLDLDFEDLGEQALKNIARPVRVYRVAAKDPHPNPPPPAGKGEVRAPSGHPPPLAAEGGVGVAAAPVALALPDKPSIAVLPFQNMSGDPEQEYFVDGMVEEIITALSRIRWLFVIARNSSFTYKGQAVDVKRVGRELGVRYVLEGSVRKAGNRVRITGQLIDTESGAHLWADRFDGSLEDVFDLQDQVAISVAGVIEPTLQVVEAARSARRPTSDLTAYDLFLRALVNFFPPSQERVIKNLALLEQAIERDPNFGPALAWAAICHLRSHQDGWASDPNRARQQGVELAQQALRVAGSDPGVIVNAAYPLAYFGEPIGAMIALIDRSVLLHPSYARGWYLSGVLRLMAGDIDRAIADIERSARLSPRDPVGTRSMLVGIGHFFAHRFESAARELEQAVQERPRAPLGYRFLAASYAHLGRLDDARNVIDRLCMFAPIIGEDMLSWRRAEDRQLLESGLQRAMGEGVAPE
ncbi:MAG TPA: adenylate/guanylate cyclase domain-containing protein [Stellaceae bacterium]|nr:adenylate/guanylate cyclase domain-containing protein [Stellaceae bacterium]